MQNLNIALFLRAVMGCVESPLGGPRSPSFTKKGPGRRAGHTNKVLARAFDTCIQAQKLAQKRKAQRKLGEAHVPRIGGLWGIRVLHDDLIGTRNGKLTFRNVRQQSNFSVAV